MNENLKEEMNEIFKEKSKEVYLEQCKKEYKLEVENMKICCMDKRESYDDFRNKKAYESMMLDCCSPEDLEESPYEEFVSEYVCFKNSVGFSWIFGEKVFYKVLDNEEVTDSDFEEGIENLILYMKNSKSTNI